MKTLKLTTLFSLMLFSIVAIAKNITTEIKVEGQCGDCKERIETALDVKGISFAEWDVETKMLSIRYNDRKITEDEIHTIISELGYSTDKKEAKMDAQKNLPMCCQPKDKKKACCSDKEGCHKKS